MEPSIKRLDEWGMQPTQVDLTDTLGLSAPPPDSYECERIYRDIHKTSFNLDMLNYSPIVSDCFQLDLNDVLYGDEQIQQFITNKFTKVLKPECYDYLFDYSQKTPFEKWVLEKEGYTGFILESIENDNEKERVLLAPFMPYQSPILSDNFNC